MSDSLGTSQGDGGRRRRRTRARAGEINRERQDGDGAFHGVFFKRARKTYVGRAALNWHVNDEVEFIRAGVTADDGGDAALAGKRAGESAVRRHREVGGAFFIAFGRGVFQGPFAGEVAFWRILWPVGFTKLKFLSVNESHFDLSFFGEEVTIRNQKIRDLALFDGAGAVRYAKDFRGRKSERANGGIGGKAGVDRFLDGFDDIGGWRRATRAADTIPNSPTNRPR